MIILSLFLVFHSFTMTKSKNVNLNFKKTIQISDALKANDVSMIKQLGRSPGGFLNNDIRCKVWYVFVVLFFVSAVDSLLYMRMVGQSYFYRLRPLKRPHTFLVTSFFCVTRDPIHAPSYMMHLHVHTRWRFSDRTIKFWCKGG